MWTAVGLKTLTYGACLPIRESWDYGHKRGSRAHAGMAMVVVEVRGWWKFPRWKAFLPSCPATSLCARATRVLGLRRPRITFTDGEVRVRGQRPCRRSAAPPCCAFTCGAGILGLRRAGVTTRGCLDCHFCRVCLNDALRELGPRRLPVVCAMAPPSVRHGRPSFLPALIGSRRTRDRTSTGLACCCLCGASRCWCCR